MSLQGKRILLTGATGGLGTATMELLKKRGAKVIGIDKVNNDKSNDGIIIADLKDTQAVTIAVQEAISRLGGLDILINNAGVLDLQDAGAPPDEEVRNIMEVNLFSLWKVTAAALPSILESKGRVINIASLFAVVNAPYIPAYSCSKRAVSAFSDILRFQYGNQIKVITLYPGYMDTPIHDTALRQGLSVGRLVTFYIGGAKVFSLEEPLFKAARGVVRACTRSFIRDSGLTFLGSLTLFFARHTPRLVDGFMKWRIGQLVKKAGLKVVLD